MSKDLEKRVKHIVRSLKRRMEEYQSACLSVKNPMDSNRYEGISIGTRWAMEDLEKTLTKTRK